MSFRWEKLGDVAHVYIGVPTKITDRVDAGQPCNVLTVRSLTGSGIFTTGQELYELGERDLDKYRVKPGDVLISARSTSLKTGIVASEHEDSVINATLLGIRCRSELEPRFLVAWLDQPEGQAALAIVSQSATQQMNITVSGLSELAVPIPPLESQRSMVALLEAADEAYVTAIQAADDRRRIAKQIVISRVTGLIRNT